MNDRAHRAVVGLGVVAAATGLGRLAGYGFGLHTIVRCRRGHLFTTVWIPGVKLKGIDLGIARIQRCPVGAHWTVVTPVRDSTLTAWQRARARARHDVWLP